MPARDRSEGGGVAVERLRKRAEFLRTRGGRSWGATSLLLQARPNEKDAGGTARFGFTATKRLGSAVQRNRARRRLKEAVRLVAPAHARAGYDYVVIARQGSLTQAFQDIVKELQTALRRVHEEGTRPRART